MTNMIKWKSGETGLLIPDCPNFYKEEFESKGSDDVENIIDLQLIIALQETRNYLSMPIKINSGYRTPKHNAKIGGIEYSPHTCGIAADIVIKGFGIQEYRKLSYFFYRYHVRGIGIDKYNGDWMHIDTRDSEGCTYGVALW